jgi:hypothetical protein
MGTLDDAIREHLELKRRLGAPEDELEQKEAEAFGPIGAARPAAGQPAPQQTAEAAAPSEPEPTEEHAQTAGDAPGESWAPSAEEDLLDRDEVLPEESLEPNGSHAVPDPLPPPPADGRLAERAPDEESVAEWQDEPEPSEDVLEETPEFLEETPEHDRLWFEQKPPKDFDLD